MMVDNAIIESDRLIRCGGLTTERWTNSCTSVNPETAYKPLNLNWFMGVHMCEFNAFRHSLGVRQDATRMATPYFIHIVRANRAHDTIGRCLDVSQVGQQEKQTVAG